MAARQNHGFINEHKVCKRENLITWKQFVEANPQYKESCGEYVSTWDAVDLSSPSNALMVQIKTIKEGAAVELGDIFRNSKKSKPFRLIVEFYEKEDKTRSKIVKTFDILVDPEKWQSHFKFSDYEEWKEWINNKVSNCYSYDQTWKAEREERKSNWHRQNPTSLVTPTFKRDHKKQRRIQCSVNSNNFPKFVESVRLV